MLKRIVPGFVLVFCLVLTGCTNQAVINPQEATKPQVAVSIVPQESFIKAVAGDLVEVVTLIPPGKSPENYAPIPQEMIGLSKASIYFTVGVPSEQANIVPKSMALNPSLKLISLADEVKKVYPEKEFAPGSRDPHIWLSPKRVRIMIDVISRELSALDPQNLAIYERNAQAYKAQLDQVDQEIKASLNHLSQKAFVVYHPAFGYFAEDYGLVMLSLEEEGKEATAKGLQEKIEEAQRLGLKVVFYQAEVDSKQSRAFAAELGGRTQQVEPLAAAYIENLKKMADAFASVSE